MNKFPLQEWRYMQQVRSWLPCTRKMKKAIIKEIESNMREFLQEQPTASYEEITERFGSPQQIAATYVGEMEMSELLRNLTIRKKILKIITCLVLILSLIWVGAVGIALFRDFSMDDGYYDVYIDEGYVSSETEGST